MSLNLLSKSQRIFESLNWWCHMPGGADSERAGLHTLREKGVWPLVLSNEHHRQAWLHPIISLERRRSPSAQVNHICEKDCCLDNSLTDGLSVSVSLSSSLVYLDLSPPLNSTLSGVLSYLSRWVCSFTCISLSLSLSDDETRLSVHLHLTVFF